MLIPENLVVLDENELVSRRRGCIATNFIKPLNTMNSYIFEHGNSVSERVILEDLRKYGVVIIRDYLNEGELEKLKLEFDAALMIQS
jgi:hypothetical protein